MWMYGPRSQKYGPLKYRPGAYVHLRWPAQKRGAGIVGLMDLAQNLSDTTPLRSPLLSSPHLTIWWYPSIAAIRRRLHPILLNSDGDGPAAAAASARHPRSASVHRSLSFVLLLASPMVMHAWSVFVQMPQRAIPSSTAIAMAIRRWRWATTSSSSSSSASPLPPIPLSFFHAGAANACYSPCVFVTVLHKEGASSLINPRTPAFFLPVWLHSSVLSLYLSILFHECHMWISIPLSQVFFFETKSGKRLA